MRRIVLLGVLMLTLARPVEASWASDGVDAVYTWATSPINCAAEWASKVAVASADFIRCFLHNANPERMIP